MQTQFNEDLLSKDGTQVMTTLAGQQDTGNAEQEQLFNSQEPDEELDEDDDTDEDVIENGDVETAETEETEELVEEDFEVDNGTLETEEDTEDHESDNSAVSQ